MFRNAVLILMSASLLACQPSVPSDADADADPAQATLAEERAALEALETQVAADRDAVAGFEVLHAGYAYGPDPRSGQPVPTLKVALANGSQLTVSRVSLQARLANEGEGTPWLDQVFDVPLADPLEPGAGGAVTMTPSGDSDWAMKAPPDGVPVRVRVLPLALETPDGRRLLTEHAFADGQRERLAELRASQP